jgi:hypothetical protein
MAEKKGQSRLSLKIHIRCKFPAAIWASDTSHWLLCPVYSFIRIHQCGTKRKKPGKYQAIHKLLTGIGPVKYNGFMRFIGSVLHFVLHISEDGIIFIEASV